MDIVPLKKKKEGEKGGFHGEQHSAEYSLVELYLNNLHVVTENDKCKNAELKSRLLLMPSMCAPSSDTEQEQAPSPLLQTHFQVHDFQMLLALLFNVKYNERVQYLLRTVSARACVKAFYLCTFISCELSWFL